MSWDHVLITGVNDFIGRHMLEKGPYRSGEVFNVPSGISRRIEEMVEIFHRHAQCVFEVTVDRTLFRPGEPPKLQGDKEKLRVATGWEPQLSFDQPVVDVLAHARATVTSGFPARNTAQKGGAER